MQTTPRAREDHHCRKPAREAQRTLIARSRTASVSALGQRLLKIVQQPVTSENLRRGPTLQKPVQHIPVDGPAMISFNPSSHDSRQSRRERPIRCSELSPTAKAGAGPIGASSRALTGRALPSRSDAGSVPPCDPPRSGAAPRSAQTSTHADGGQPLRATAPSRRGTAGFRRAWLHCDPAPARSSTERDPGAGRSRTRRGPGPGGGNLLALDERQMPPRRHRGRRRQTLSAACRPPLGPTAWDTPPSRAASARSPNRDRQPEPPPVLPLRHPRPTEGPHWRPQTPICTTLSSRRRNFHQ
jgi:hypothetical protein